MSELIGSYHRLIWTEINHIIRKIKPQTHKFNIFMLNEHIREIEKALLDDDKSSADKMRLRNHLLKTNILLALTKVQEYELP